MKLYSIQWVGLTVIILALSACNGNLPDTKYIVNIEGLDFQATVNEEIRGDTLSLAKVRFSTINGAYCEHAKLAAASSRLGNTISFRIHNIEKTNDCDNASSNPSRNLVAGFLENGTYDISLGISQFLHYTGTLEVDASKYKLSFENAPNLFVEPAITYRIPHRGLWFRISYLERKKALAEECYNRVKKMGTPYDFPDGYYSYFQMENGEVQLTSPDKYYYLENKEGFILLPNTHRQTLDTLYSIFQDYREQAGHQFYVDLKTWNNEVFKID